MMWVGQDNLPQDGTVSRKLASTGSASSAGSEQAPGRSFNGLVPRAASVAGSASDADKLLRETLAELESSDLPALQEKWREAYGKAAPSRFGAEFLKRAIGYRLQEQVLGGLSRQAQLRLKAWGNGGRSEGAASLPSPSAVKPGTRFVREWQNVTHEVLALEGDSFVYRNKTYRSLTEIARLITGTHQSGPRFFGIGKYAPKRSRAEPERLSDG